jgi:hypothetical protein
MSLAGMSKYLALMEDVVEPDLSDPSSGRGRRPPRLFSETRKWETIKADWLNVPHPSLGEDPVGLYHWRDAFAADAYEGGTAIRSTMNGRARRQRFGSSSDADPVIM